MNEDILEKNDECKECRGCFVAGILFAIFLITMVAYYDNKIRSENNKRYIEHIEMNNSIKNWEMIENVPSSTKFYNGLIGIGVINKEGYSNWKGIDKKGNIHYRKMRYVQEGMATIQPDEFLKGKNQCCK